MVGERDGAEALLGPLYRTIGPHLALALSGQSSHAEREEQGADGLPHWRLMVFVPDRRAVGEGSQASHARQASEVSGVIVSSTDITWLKASEQRLRELNERLMLALDQAESTIVEARQRVTLLRLAEQSDEPLHYCLERWGQELAATGTTAFTLTR